MTTVVVLTTVELDGPTLGRIAGDADEIHVVVPAVEQTPLQWLANEEDEARDLAGKIGSAVEAAAPTGRTSSTESPEAPAQALLDAVREHRPDRVVVALRDGDAATWLEQGELARTPGMVEGVPVDRICVG